MVIAKLFQEDAATKNQTMPSCARVKVEVNLAEAVTTPGVQQGIDRQDDPDTFRIHEFLRMKPPKFTRSILSEDLENFLYEL